MRKRITCLTLAALLSVSTALAGCETAGGSAGGGAALGALAGGIIGNQSGRALEGAAIGAIVGGLAGLIVHDVRNRQTRSAQQTYQEYNYEPQQGFQMNIERSNVTPATVAPGGEVSTSLQYATLGTGGGVAVDEESALYRDGRKLAVVWDDESTRTDGTWEKYVELEMPNNAEQGSYEITHTLRAENRELQRSSSFLVDSAAADAGNTRYAANN